MFHSTTCNMADSGPQHTVLHLVKLQSICIMKTPDPPPKSTIDRKLHSVFLLHDKMTKYRHVVGGGGGGHFFAQQTFF